MINKVQVTDPRARGQYSDPVLTIYTDNFVNETGEPILVPGHDNLRIIPCGLFYAIELKGGGVWDDSTHPNSVAHVNVARVASEQLMAVKVHNSVDGEVLDLYAPVPRLRRFLRSRSSGEYGIIVDEAAALLGLLKWRLELVNPVCYGGAMPGRANCKSPVVKTVVDRDTHLTLCQKHVTQEEHRRTKNRTRRTPKG